MYIKRCFQAKVSTVHVESIINSLKKPKILILKFIFEKVLLITENQKKQINLKNNCYLLYFTQLTIIIINYYKCRVYVI